MGARSDNGVTGRARVVEKSRDGTAAQKTTVSDDTLPPGGASRHDWPVPCCRIVLNITLTAGGTPRQRRMERRPPADLLPFVARNHARQAKPDRALAPLSMLATLAPPAANAAWRGRGAEAMFRGAEPSEAQLHEAQASRPWVHAAFRPCGTRAAFAATNVAAHAGAKEHVTHRAINTILQQSVGRGPVAEPCRSKAVRPALRHAWPRESAARIDNPEALG